MSLLRFLRSKRDPNRELKKMMGDYRLPSFPAVAMKAMQTLRDDRRSISDAADVLMADPGLSSTLMKMVNSAGQGLSRPVNNVSHAAALLGRSQIEAVLVSVAIGGMLPKKSAALDMQQFWRTSARRAAVSRGLANCLHPASAATCYTAGLLQDMAQPLLAAARPDAYAPLLSGAESELSSLERERFGWTHAEVAGWLCKSWNFPDSLTGPIVTHHGENESETAEHCAPPAVLLLASVGSDLIGEGGEELIEYAHSTFGIGYDEARQIISNGIAEGDEAALLFL